MKSVTDQNLFDFRVQTIGSPQIWHPWDIDMGHREKDLRVPSFMSTHQLRLNPILLSSYRHSNGIIIQ